MKIIKADNVVYEYIRRDEEGNVEGITKAVNDVSLDIEQGQFIAILGHNGSGKSTLAKHMNAILNPTEGTLWVDGMDTKDEDNIWKVRQTAGMVFQNPDHRTGSGRRCGIWSGEHGDPHGGDLAACGREFTCGRYVRISKVFPE